MTRLPPVSSFDQAGSPLAGLIDVAGFEARLTPEMETALAEAAGISDDEIELITRSIPRRTWFLRMVCSAVRYWLAGEARRPALRTTVNELRQLMRLLYDILNHSDWSRLAEAADALEALSTEASNEISSHGYIEVPAAADIRNGNVEAVHVLFGLIPITPVFRGRAHPFGRHARYRGARAGELNRRGRPRDNRLERLAEQLVVAYEQTTGRKAGRGARAPFDRFFALLLTLLFNTDDESERGDRVLRRVIRWHKSYGRKQHKAVRKTG